MKKSFLVLMLSAALAAPALAQETAPQAAATTVAAQVEPAPAAPVGAPVSRVRTGQVIYTADGERLGEINRVSDRGTPLVLVSGGRFVSVALSSLTRIEGRLTTSLSREELTN